MKAVVGLFGLLILLSSLGTVYGDTSARNEYGEIQVENANYEISPYDMNQVKIFGTITDSSGRNKILITITNPEGEKEELSVIPTTHGYFETYLLFDRNDIKGIYEAEAFTQGGDFGNFIGKISFQIYDKNNPIVSTKEPEAVPEPKPVEIEKKPSANENKSSIPAWIKNIASFWANGQISDDEYLSTIEWLIDNEIIRISQSLTRIPSQTSSFEDKGDFKLFFNPTNDNILQTTKNDLENIASIELLPLEYNLIFKLPYDVPLHYSECGSTNAYYDPAKKEITICYELVDYLLTQFSIMDLLFDDDDDFLDPSRATISVLFFVGYHELGHALIDIYDLPVTGMEEDAVDQFSAVMMLDQGLSGIIIMNHAALWFSFESDKAGTENLPFWDEHSLSQQRMYNILCWMYGSDPIENSNVIELTSLPIERAVRCPSEYEQMVKGWETLLSPYVKNKLLLN